VLHDYFKIKGFTADWDQLDECEDERLVTTLSMICPFDVPEKQALLEAASLPDRTQLLIAILEMASHSEGDETGARH
jgi:Lon protease-like protein